MAQLMHQQPTNVKMAWLNPDNPLAFSVMKRTSKISKLGESLEIEAIDEFEGNLARASRRQNLTKVYAPSQAPSKYETSSTSPFKNENDVFSNSDDENDNLEADEISLELKLYDQGPVYLMNLDSKSPTFRSRTRRSMRYRPSSRISSNDVDDNSPSNFDQSEDDDGDICRDDSNDENFDEKDCQDRPETPSTQEPTYEMVPPICSMMPGQRLSTIYVKPAEACFDLTDVCPGIYSYKVELYMKDGNSSYLLHIQQSATIQRLDDTITSIAAGDFDGDFQMDVLITTKPNSDPLNVNIPTKAYVYWGNVTSMKYGPPTLVTDQLSDQPLVMDCNGDMVPDIFGADMTGKRMFWKTMLNGTKLLRKFVEEPLPGHEGRQLMVPNSNAFLDLTGNFAADLFMVTSSNGSSDVTFEIWSYIASQEEGNHTWQFNRGYSPPTQPQIAHLGVSTFADMNADSFLDHILPVCFNDDCTKGAIYVKFLGPMETEWTKMFNLSQLVYDQKSWGFVPPSVQLTDFTVLPLVARTGDFNLDTLNDVLVLVQAGVQGSYERRIVLLQNMGDTLQAVWATDPANDIVSPVLATFIDIQRTGQLDIVIVNKTSGVNQHEIYLMDNTLAIDAYFVQTEVLSGFCKPKCPLSSHSIPYGVAQPGPMVRYDTTSSIGQPQRTGGSQLSQSAYFSLQLPYVLLGLGQNPNFVDVLMVGVPGPTQEGTQNKRVHQWTSVIPNSQLIVIPYPLDSPNDWISKILIIPGQSVLLTGIVLISTCVVLALTAAFLHLKERKDDEKEKRQEAHRFHFDAM